MKYTLMLIAAFAVLITVPNVATSKPPQPRPPRNFYIRHNLISDLPAHAERLDPNLVNPWGIAYSPTGPFWISDNHTGVSTVYDAQGRSLPHGNPLVVTIPPPAGGTSPASPTGIVFNGTPNFALAAGAPALFIFATEDGTISGWNPSVDPTHAVLKVDKSASGAIYKGLASGSVAGASFLYATNFNAGTVDVFDSNFAAAMPGSFQDPSILAGFAPFGIQNIGGKLLVTYAMQNADKADDVGGPGNGFVNVFNTDGTMAGRLISKGPLNSPWGIALAPSNFGGLGGSLLIGNFGDGAINAFDPVTGASRGMMLTQSGRQLAIQGLWALAFGNGGQAGDPGVLYFTAGIPGPGEVEDHGLFGQIRPRQPGDVDEGGGDDHNIARPGNH